MLRGRMKRLDNAMTPATWTPELAEAYLETETETRADTTGAATTRRNWLPEDDDRAELEEIARSLEIAPPPYRKMLAYMLTVASENTGAGWSFKNEQARWNAYREAKEDLGAKGNEALHPDERLERQTRPGLEKAQNLAAERQQQHDTGAVVETIRQARAMKAGWRAIAAILQATGETAPAGGTWTHKAARRIAARHKIQ